VEHSPLELSCPVTFAPWNSRSRCSLTLTFAKYAPTVLLCTDTPQMCPFPCGDNEPLNILGPACVFISKLHAGPLSRFARAHGCVLDIYRPRYNNTLTLCGLISFGGTSLLLPPNAESTRYVCH